MRAQRLDGQQVKIGFPPARLLLATMFWIWIAWQAAALEPPARVEPWDSLATPLFSHLGTAEGLPHPVAFALAQDSNGFIWIGTPGGLARWDGYRIRVFHHDANDPGSPPEDNIPQLLADPRGGLWLDSVTGILARYDPVREVFKAYPDTDGSPSRAYGLAVDADGLWAGGRGGLVLLDIASGVWQPEALHSDGPIRSIGQDRQGTLWIGAGRQLFRRSPGAAHFEPVAALDGAGVTAWFQDGAGRMWFGTNSGQVGTVDGTAVSLSSTLSPSGSAVSAIVEPQPGVLWISLFGGGIRELRIADSKVRAFHHDAAIEGSLADDFVTGMLIDRSGLVWVSSQRGVDHYNPSNHWVATITPGAQNGFLGKDLRSMAASPDGKVWLGFRAEGIALFDPIAGRVTPLRSGHGDTDTRFGIVQALAATANGGLWCGSIHGLYRVDPATGQSNRFEPLGNASVLTLLDEGARLWVGGARGLARIDEATGQMRLYSHGQADPGSISDNSVFSLLRDRQQRLWVGTQRGLNLFDPDRGTFRRFLHDPADPDSLPDNVINSMLEDSQGRLWVATLGGIGILDPDSRGKPRFRHLRVGDGLPNDAVVELLEGQEGLIWASSFDGIAAIDSRSLAIHTYRQADGVAITTHWGGSGVHLPDGTLLFGGFGGMTVIRNEHPKPWTYRPPIAITDLRVGGVKVPSAGPIVVPPGDRTIQAEFTALDLSSPELNRYAYRLGGFDSDWITADSHHRLATYSNLPPGRYVLAVRGSNRDGLWTDQPLRLPIDVLPTWYETRWFTLAEIVAALVAVLGLFRGRTTFLRRRQRQLETRVAEQTIEIAAAHSRAVAGEEAARQAQEAAETANEAKSHLLAVVSHEIRTPLNGVLALTQILDRSRLDREQLRFLEIAESSGEALRRLVDSILQYERLGAISQPARCDPVDFRRLVDEAVELFRSQLAAKQVAIGMSVSSSVPLIVRCDRMGLQRVLLNLIGNAVKFTLAGEIRVDADFTPDEGKQGGQLHVSVSDSGVGIAPEKQQAIFDEFVQADDSITRRFGGTGLGLTISRRIVEMMGGRLTVDSVVDAGSVFHLFLPVGRAAAELETAPRSPDGPELAVLVVDDDEINRAVAVGLLGRLGHDVTLAQDGRAAVDAAAAVDFDAALVDLHMPAIGGIEVIGQLRASTHRRQAAVPMRIFAMTADLTENSRAHCAAAGVDGIIAKPLHLDALRHALNPATQDESAPAALPPEFAAWLDEAAIARQLEILGAVELMRLIRLFQRASRPLIASLFAAAAANDRPTVSALAHRLRSGAGALGMVRLASVAEAIEAAAAGPGDLVAETATLSPVRRTSLAAMAAMRRSILARGKPDGGWPGSA